MFIVNTIGCWYQNWKKTNKTTKTFICTLQIYCQCVKNIEVLYLLWFFFCRCWIYLLLSSWTTLIIWQEMPPFLGLITWMSMYECGETLSPTGGKKPPSCGVSCTGGQHVTLACPFSEATKTNLGQPEYGLWLSGGVDNLKCQAKLIQNYRWNQTSKYHHDWDRPQKCCESAWYKGHLF